MSLLENMFAADLTMKIQVESSRYAGSGVSDEKERESRCDWVDSSKVDEKICFC